MKISLGIAILLSLSPLLATADVVVPVDSVESYVNVRMSPDAKSEVVGQLRQGKNMPFVQTVSGWHEVTLEGGGNGFVHEDWALVIVAAEAIATTAVVEAASEAADTGDATDEVTDAVAEVADADDGSDAATGTEIPDESVAATKGVVAEADVEELASEEAAGEPPIAEEPAAHSVACAVDEAMIDAAECVSGDDASQTLAAVEAAPEDTLTTIVPVLVGPAGPGGLSGPPGPPGAATVEGSVDYLVKFTAPTIGGNSQIFDDGRNIGIGTDAPKQRLEVNGNIQIHEQNSNVAGLMLTQSSGETGYIMHNRASTLTIGAGSVDRITINREGNVGIGMSRPAHPIEMASGAHVTAGGVWTNSSSIERKENISDLTPEEALRTLADLEPVHFNYKQDTVEQHVGFIAEDVPDLVATADRKGLSTMDIVAVLTKVVQMQQQQIEELEARLSQ